MCATTFQYHTQINTTHRQTNTRYYTCEGVCVTDLPKSQSLSTPDSGSSSRFCGLMSRWQTPWECRYARLRNTWYIYSYTHRHTQRYTTIYVEELCHHTLPSGYSKHITSSHVQWMAHWTNTCYSSTNHCHQQCVVTCSTTQFPQCTIIIIRDGRIVIFCRIPDSVNRRLISGQFWIRIRIFDVTLPLVYTYKNYSKSHPMLYFSVIFNRQ